MKNGTELKIEKGIAIPPRANQGKGYTAALRKLKKGESVVLPMHITRATNLGHQLCGSGYFTCRTVEGGTRVWRLK